MGYGLKNPDEKGVIPGYHQTTAQTVLDGFLEMADFLLRSDADETYDSGPGVWLKILHSDGLTPELAADINELMRSISCSAVATLDEHGHLEWRINVEEVDDELRQPEVAIFLDLVKRLDADQDLHEIEVAFVDALKRAEVDHGLRPPPVAFIEAAERAVESLTSGAIETIENASQLSKLMLAIYAHAFAYLLNDGVLENLRRCQRPECKKFFIGGPRAKWCSENCGGIVRTKAKRKRDRKGGYEEHHIPG